MTQTNHSVSLDTTFNVLGHSYRRCILLALSAHTPRTEDEFTAATLSADNAGETERKRLNIALFHSHLPKLADAGYIEWDSETGMIRRGPNFETVAPFLELLGERETCLPAD